MTKLKLPLAALIAVAAAMVATPTVARTGHVTSQQRAEDSNVSASPITHHIDGHVGISAPGAGAFPPAPADGENCDVGDDSRVC